VGSITSHRYPRMGEGPIALLLPTLEIGGAERSAAVLAGALAARGEPVDLVVGRVRGPLGHSLVPPGVRLVELGTRRVLTSFRALSRYLRREQPVALLANLTHANAMALLTRDYLGPPVRIIIVEHSVLSGFARNSGVLRHRLLPLVARGTYGRADAVVAVSAGGGSDLAQITRLPESRITVIPNPIPFDQLTRSACAPAPHLWLEQSLPVLVAIGSLRPVKGYPTLLRAFGRLRERRIARLVILGQGPERRRLERLVDSMGLGADVILPGNATNPYAWISRAACVVMTSLSEGQPTVLLEAIMLGRSVVAVDRDGTREVLDGGRLGGLAAPDDLDSLVEQVERAIDQPKRPVPADVIAAHDPDHVAARYLELLRNGRWEQAPELSRA
jgi:glycosyltransferase involved in cell wall biosynthesis